MKRNGNKLIRMCGIIMCLICITFIANAFFPAQKTAVAAIKPPDKQHYYEMELVDHESGIGVVSETLTFDFPPFDESYELSKQFFVNLKAEYIMLSDETKNVRLQLLIEKTQTSSQEELLHITADGKDITYEIETSYEGSVKRNRFIYEIEFLKGINHVSVAYEMRSASGSHYKPTAYMFDYNTTPAKSWMYFNVFTVFVNLSGIEEKPWFITKSNLKLKAEKGSPGHYIYSGKLPKDNIEFLVCSVKTPRHYNYTTVLTVWLIIGFLLSILVFLFIILTMRIVKNKKLKAARNKLKGGSE